MANHKWKARGEQRDAGDDFEQKWGLGPYFDGPYIDKFKAYTWVRDASVGIDGSPMTSDQKFALMLVAERTNPYPRQCWSVVDLAETACMSVDAMWAALNWLIANGLILGPVFFKEHLIGTLACPVEEERVSVPSIEAERRRRRVADAKRIGRHTRGEWVTMLQFCGLRCLACGSEGEMTKDHIVPIAKGGDDTIANLQPICSPCNSSKGTSNWGDLRPQGWREAVATKGGRDGT